MKDVTVCRICLEDGAEFPIFSKDLEDKNVYSKLVFCLNEEIQDIAGFPRAICEQCNNTLDMVCNFIKRYKESTSVLQQQLSVKQEKCDSGDDYNIQSEVEIEMDDIKPEDDVKVDLKNTDYLISLMKPLRIIIKKEPIEMQVSKPKKTLNNSVRTVKSKPLIPNKKISHKTNIIASSLLESPCEWDGEKWCLTQTKVSDPSRIVIKQERIIPQRQKKIKIKIPKTKKNEERLCDLCGRVFKDQNKLTVHKKTVHFKKPAKCEICSKVCASDFYLRAHIKRKHSTDKNFICSQCGKTFAFKNELTTHSRNSHGNRPKKKFPCGSCDKVFACAKSVLMHERAVHTGVRPEICNVCSATFTHIDYLKEHMRLHTGETPFKCPVCGRGYAQRCNMKSHLRIHRISELTPQQIISIKPGYLKRMKL